MRGLLYERYELSHRFDIYVAFIERAYGLLRATGLLGFIVPNKFFVADYGVPIRGLISRDKALALVVDFEDKQVFDEATIYTAIIILSRRPADRIKYIAAWTSRGAKGFQAVRENDVDVGALSEAPWAFVDVHVQGILERARKFSRLGELFDIQHGLQTGIDSFFLLELVSEPTGKSVLVRGELDDEPFELETSAVRTVSYFQKLWTAAPAQAATLRSPSTNTMPSIRSFSFSPPFNFRQPFSAFCASLNAIARPARREPGPLVR